ncbi:MAG: DUF167 domain-containing protein [Chloroflexota bacterium]|nr:DUF167 domain-containing protein [Chloroflexota bacterium]
MSESVVVVLRVTPRSSRDAVEGVDDEGALRVRVTAAPADGAANKAVIKLVAKALGVPKSALTLVSGASSRHKRLRLDGFDAALVRARWPGAQVRDG